MHKLQNTDCNKVEQTLCARAREKEKEREERCSFGPIWASHAACAKSKIFNCKFLASHTRTLGRTHSPWFGEPCHGNTHWEHHIGNTNSVHPLGTSTGTPIQYIQWEHPREHPLITSIGNIHGNAHWVHPLGTFTGTPIGYIHFLNQHWEPS